MANPLTQGQPSGAGENSTSPPQTWTQQQEAIQKANQQRAQADQAAAEAAFAAAKRRPSKNNVSNTLDPEAFGGVPFTVTPAPAAPKGRVVGKKGK